MPQQSPLLQNQALGRDFAYSRGKFLQLQSLLFAVLSRRTLVENPSLSSAIADNLIGFNRGRFEVCSLAYLMTIVSSS